MSTALRRAGTIPLFLLLTVLMTAALPLWLPVAWIAALLFPAARTAPRVLAFLTAYLWCETIGIVVSGWLWLRHGLGRSPEARKRFEEGNFALQFWWANALKRAAERLFRLRFVVEGDEVLGGDGVLLLPRHCSIGDTILPVVFYCVPHGRRLRYVLKRELLLDPCLDIVGNRLRNYFADRSSTDTAREVAGVQGLLEDLPADHSVLIYPEGTRFSAVKRAHVLQRIEARGDAAATARARARSHVLPPRPAGTLGLLEANPGRDVVFMAHTGFEQSSNFAQLFNGSWLDTEVRMRFWRVPFEALPTTPDGRRAFLDEQWDRMEREVAQLVGDRADVTIDSP